MLSSTRVPVVFNDKHPSPDLHGKQFLPLTLNFSQGPEGAFMTTLYLDLKELPKRTRMPKLASNIRLRPKRSDAKEVERDHDTGETSQNKRSKIQLTTTPRVGSVFISYRRQDSADITGRIYDRLVERIGTEAVYKDVDSIPLGVDFRKHLQDSVAQCDVLLAVIGKNWLEASSDKGNEGRSLDDPRDFLRIEIETALERDIPLIPLLVQGASVPREQDLPPSLMPLVYRNAVAIRPDPDFRIDMDRLIKQLQNHLEMKKTR
jgi:hypothetical protein